MAACQAWTPGAAPILALPRDSCVSILAVTGELVIGSPGLGADIETANSSNSIPIVYALIVVTGLIGLAANLLARAVERYALAWHPSVRADVPA